MLYAIVAVIALIIDQAVKYWTTAHIVLNSGQHKLIPGFIHLANVHNTGAAFSFMEGARWVFVALCALFVAALIYLLVNNIIKGKTARWMAVLVMAGAVGNCIDRIISGYVVDMFEFEFKIFGQQFPVFNVADIFITVCGIAFCVCILLEKPEDERAKRARQAEAAPYSQSQSRTAALRAKSRLSPVVASVRPAPAAWALTTPLPSGSAMPRRKTQGYPERQASPPLREARLRLTSRCPMSVRPRSRRLLPQLRQIRRVPPLSPTHPPTSRAITWTIFLQNSEICDGDGIFHCGNGRRAR